MRKRYTEEELAFIEREASLGTDCNIIANAMGVSVSAIHHVLSRRNIKFCRKPLNEIPGETWQSCPGVLDVMVSNLGRFVRISSNSVIDGYITTGGYVTVDFSGSGTYSAHRLVAQAFIPNPDNKPEVNHRDGNKTNNCADNLEWVTPSENMRHAVITGLRIPKFGQDHPRTALTEQEIVRCVKMHDEGKTYGEIADVYGVYWKTVSRHVNQYRRNAERSETIP